MAMAQWMNLSAYIKGAHGILILRIKPRGVAVLKTNNKFKSKMD